MPPLVPDISEPGRYEIVADLAVPVSLLRLVSEKDKRVDLKVDAGRLEYHLERVQLEKQSNRVELVLTLEAKPGQFSSAPTTEALPIAIAIGIALGVVGLVSMQWSVKEIRQLFTGDAGGGDDGDKGGRGLFGELRELLLIGLAGLLVFSMVRRGA